MRKFLKGLPFKKVFVFLFVSLYTFLPSLQAFGVVIEDYASEDVGVGVDEGGDILDEGISDPEEIANPEGIVNSEEVVIPEVLEEEIPKPTSTYVDGVYTVNSVGLEEYVYPDDEDVRVRFTSVTEEGDLVIKKVVLTEEEKELLNTSDDYGWDISSSMSNGSFKYDLTLPNSTESNDVEVKYSEDGNTYESIDNEIVNENVIEIKGLEHFTVFVVVETLPAEVSNGDTCTVADIEGVCYNTIQAAIDAAMANGSSEKDTIFVKNGTYNEELNIIGGDNIEIIGESRDNVIIDTSGASSYGIEVRNSDEVMFEKMTVIGATNSNSGYTFKIANSRNIRLTEVTVENSQKSAFDLNGVYGATINNIKAVNTVNGFGLMLMDSHNISVANIETENNAWGGVSIQTSGDYFPGGSSNIEFIGTFDVKESLTPLLLEKDGPEYYEITNIDLPDKFNYVVYGYDTSKDYKQWIYKETLDEAISLVNMFLPTSSYTDFLIYDIEEENYWVIPGMSIQDAIDDATNGDTINVLAGEYNENIVINKSIILLGAMANVDPTIESSRENEAAESVIDASGSGDGIIVNGSGVSATVNGFTIKNTGDNKAGLIAGAFDTNTYGEVPASASFLYNIVTGGQYKNGIAIENGATGEIKYNRVDGAEILDGEWSGSGILVAGSNGVEVSNNLVKNSELGITVVGYREWKSAPANNNLIQNNNVTNNIYGISVEAYALYTQVTGNQISNTTGATDSFGIIVNSYNLSWEKSIPTGTLVQGNIFVNNTFDLSTGVYDAADELITGPTVDARGNTWSVSDQDNLNEIEERINHSCQSSLYTHGACNTDDYEAGYGFVQYKDLLAPSSLRFSTTSGEVLGCGVYINQYNIVANWDAPFTTGIASYEYRSYNPTTGWIYGPVNVGASLSRTGAFTVGEGTYGFAVRAIDLAGNTSAWTSESLIDSCQITYDKTKPIIEILGPVENSSHSGSFDIKVKGTDESSGLGLFVVNIKNSLGDNIGTCVNENANGTSEHTATCTINTSSYSDGQYSIRTNVKDRAGNTSQTLSRSFIFDNENPTGNIQGIRYTKGDVQTFITNDNTPILYGTCSDNNGVSKVEVKIDNEIKTLSCSNGTWASSEFTALTNGVHNIMLTVTDLAGNIFTKGQDITIDTIAPTAIHKYFKNGVEITDSIAYVKGTRDLTFRAEYSDEGSGIYQDSYVIFDSNEEGTARTSKAYCEWRKPGNTLLITENPLTTPVPFTNCSATLLDGEYFMYHQVYDKATRQDIPTINQFRDYKGLHFVVDTQVPIPPTVTLTANGLSVPTNGYTSSETFTFNLSSSEDTTRYQLKYWNNIQGSQYKEDSPWSLTDIAKAGYMNPFGSYNDKFTQGEGEHYFVFSACDAAGNCSEYSNPFVVTYDKTAPDVQITAPTSTHLTGIVEIKGSVTDANPHHYLFVIENSNNVIVAGLGQVNSTGSFTNESLLNWDTTSLPDGQYTIKLEAEDSANNKDSGSAQWLVVNVDHTDPTVNLQLNVNENGFKAIFSEDVNVTDATDPANYFLENWPTAGGTGDLAGDATITYDSVTHIATVTFKDSGWHISPEQQWGVQNIHDLAGNVLAEPYTEYSTPMVPPVTTVSGIDADWHSTDVTVTLTCTDTDGSGCYKTYYSLDGGITYQEGNTVIVSTEGENIITFYSKDNAGNEEKVKESELVYIDNTPPVIAEHSDMTLTEGETFPTDTVTLTDNYELNQVCATAADLDPNGLGSSTHCIDIDGTNYTGDQFSLADEIRKAIEDWQEAPEGSFNTIDLSVLPEGTYEISYYATDKAGNPSTTQTFTVTIQNNVPTVTISPTTVEVSEGTPGITLSTTVTNGNSPFTYQWTGDCTGTDPQTIFNPTTADDYTCTVTVTDADGDIATDSVDITVGAALGAATENENTEGTSNSTTPSSKLTPVTAYNSTYGIGGYPLSQIDERDTDEEEITEEETITQDSPEVKGEEDNEEQNGEEEPTEQEPTKWWVYPLVILPVLAIFLILWKRRKEDNEPQF